jgi:hypothetical protein
MELEESDIKTSSGLVNGQDKGKKLSRG